MFKVSLGQAMFQEGPFRGCLPLACVVTVLTDFFSWNCLLTPHERSAMSSPVLKHPRKTRSTLHGQGVILGVDTHKDVHVAAILTIAGVLLATRSFATTSDGHAATLVWAHRLKRRERSRNRMHRFIRLSADEVPPDAKRESVRGELTRPGAATQSGQD